MATPEACVGCRFSRFCDESKARAQAVLDREAQTAARIASLQVALEDVSSPEGLAFGRMGSSTFSRIQNYRRQIDELEAQRPTPVELVAARVGVAEWGDAQELIRYGQDNDACSGFSQGTTPVLAGCGIYGPVRESFQTEHGRSLDNVPFQATNDNN